MRSIIVHLHLHTPPREDPWLGEVPEDRAHAPDHDLTARLERTCWRPLTAARLLDGDGRIAKVASTLAWTSFAAQPPLLAWMARHAPHTHRAVLAADRASGQRLGDAAWGNAMATTYDHVVLPLLSRRDKVTEVRWGLRDFARRFGREASGFWLPETAADEETLDVLVACGVRHTIVAPHQLAAPDGGAVYLGDGRPFRWIGSGERPLVLVPYDAPLSAGVAYGALLRDGRAWAARMAGEPVDGEAAPGEAPDGTDHDAPWPLVTVATSAETFGHHHAFGEMALAAMLSAVTARPHVRVETPASWLARHAPDDAAVAHVLRPACLEGPSSWSCAHGVERWRRDCGCREDPTTHQRWRAPLRHALDALAAACDERFAREAPALLGADPWAVRDAYSGAPDGEPGGGTLAAVDASSDPVWARELLEMQREALRMRAADAWAGDDVADEPVRLALRSAARVVTLLGPAGAPHERALVDALAQAPGNGAELPTARDVYLKHARPALPAAVRVAAGWAAVRAVEGDAAAAVPPTWTVRPLDAPTHVVVADRRLGAESTFAVQADVAAAAPAPEALPLQRLADVDPRGVTILARALDAPGKDGVPGAMGAALKLADVPERARRTVELALRRAVVDRLLDEAARARLAAGEATLGALADAALTRAVARLGEDARPGAIARVLGLADLAESAGAGTPFDAQTVLWRLHATLDEAGRAELASVAWRLGFSLRAWRRPPE